MFKASLEPMEGISNLIFVTGLNGFGWFWDKENDAGTMEDIFCIPVIVEL